MNHQFVTDKIRVAGNGAPAATLPAVGSDDACVVQAVAFQADAETRIRKFLEDRHYQIHGAEDVRLAGQLDAALRERAELAAEQAEVSAQLKAVGDHPIEKRPTAMIRLLWIMLFGLLGLSCFNVARFAAVETQSWTAAILFSGLLTVFQPFVFKYLVVDSAPAKSLPTIRTALFWVATAVALTLAVSFVEHFAHEPDVEDLGALVQAKDFRILLGAQIILELVISCALFMWIRQLSITNVECLSERKTKLKDLVHQFDDKIAAVRAELREIAASRDTYVARGIAAWTHYQELARQYREIANQYLRSQHELNRLLNPRFNP